jgi:DNA modification methylase
MSDTKNIKAKALASGVEVWCAFDELVDITSLKSNPKNPNKHPDSQIELLSKNIKYLGWRHPITVSKRSGFIVAGHGRLMAATALGVQIVPVDYQDFNNDADEIAALVADNRLSELSETSEDDLKKILAELDGKIDIDLTGFSESDVEQLLRDVTAGESAEDDVPEVSETPVSKFSDIFEFGNHRLLCGDSTDKLQVAKLMNGKTANLVFTDPPYNVDYGDDDRKIANDNLGNAFPVFLEKVIQNIFEFSKGAIYICMSSSELDVLQSTFRRLGGHWSTFVIWAKDTFTLGRSDYHRQYEPILYGWKEGNKHFFCGDRSQSDVWEFPKPKKNDVHPTMKPVELCLRAVQNSSKPRDIVLDLFGGSGSTLMACEQVNRSCYTMEFEPKYCDVILKRFAALNPTAEILRNGKPFNFEE